jgi:hypothetical protein
VISERRRVGTLVGLATLGLVVAVGVRPISLERIVAGYVIAVTAIVLAALIRALSGAADMQSGSVFEHTLLRKPEPATRPPELVRIEREITLGTSSAGHLHSRLLPLLREAAAVRLNVELERRPDTVRAALGDETWELLRPDLPEPEDRNAPGLPLRRVRTIIDALERA